MRTIAIGDIHGCLQELQELLHLIGAAQDRLVFVGDLVDRGPDSAGVVQLIRRLEQHGSVLTVKGNHDDNAASWLLRSRKHKAAGTTIKPPPAGRLAEWAGLTPEDVDWLEALPVVAEAAPGWLAVHAGFEDRAMGRQKEDKCMRTRWIDASTGRMIQVGSKDDLDAQPPNSVWWTERWRGSDHVVYGHAVHSLTDPRVDTNEDGMECWGIDTGACFGGRLTALCLETRQLWQVQAQRAYREYKKYNSREPTSE